MTERVPFSKRLQFSAEDIERAKQDARPKWQPIETAPKDETVVLLFHPRSEDTEGVRVGWWYVDDEPDPEINSTGWYDSECASYPSSFLYGEPTYWMPLPEPPK